MKNLEEAFALQSSFLQGASNLLGTRIEKIEESVEKSDDAAAIIAVFKARSLKLYRRIIEFFVEEILRSEPNRHYFLLPHVRTLLDVYGRFIFLQKNCEDKNKEALVCLAYQLLSYASIGVGSEYKTGLDLNKEFINRQSIEFPPTASEYDHKWMRNNALTFGKRSDILTEENIHAFSVHTRKIFGAKHAYAIYSHLSEMLHGNPYYHDKPHNERFWVTALSVTNSLYMIELVDRYTLTTSLPRDFRELLSKVEGSREEFGNLWKNAKTA